MWLIVHNSTDFFQIYFHIWSESVEQDYPNYYGWTWLLSAPLISAEGSGIYSNEL